MNTRFPTNATCPGAHPSRAARRPWRRIVTLVVLLTLLAGCGGGSVSTPTPPRTPASVASPAAPTLTLRTAGSALPSSVTHFSISGADASGVTVFGPVLVLKGPSVVIGGLPASMLVLHVEAIDGDRPVADFITSVYPAEGSFTVTDPAFVDLGDPVQRSFVAMGCNRLDFTHPPITPSFANTAQLVQDFIEIASRLQPLPQYLFFTGDVVMNQVPGTASLTTQLQAWVALFATTALASSSVQLVALAGNHELNQFDFALSSDIPNPPTGDVWSQLMAPFIPSADGPTQAPPNADNVQRDESRLSFTFRHGSTLYICLNTETWEGGLTPDDVGKVPLQWVSDKLAAANADASIHNIFVVGHKPISTSLIGELNPTINPAQTWQLYALLSAPCPDGSPTKVRAYVCSHIHLWEQGIPAGAPAGSRVPQVVAGNAGSSTDSSFQPPRSYYGYTVIGETAAGAYVVESWGRPVPTPYSAQTPQPPSTLRERFTLYRP